MHLTPAQQHAFFTDGFVVVRGLFGPDEVAPIRAAFARLYAQAQRLRATIEHDGALFVLAAPPAHQPGDVVVKRVVWAGGAEPALLRLSEDPRLVEPVLGLLGTPWCEQLLCQAHFKMPGDGVAFDWHQDIQHRDKGPGTWTDVNGRGSYVQTLLLVDDMDEDNGPLRFVPPDAVVLDERGRLASGHGDYASADTGPTPRFAPGDLGGAPAPVVDAARAVTITGRAGDVLLFGPYAVHGSLPNTSATPRRVLINGYAAPGANGRVYPGRGACRRLP